MNTSTRASLAAASTLILTALLAACGGGGGGGGSTPPTTTSGGGSSSTPTPPPGTTPTPSPGATPTPTPVKTATPAPTPTPAAMGSLTIGGSALAANSTVVFTCGCTGDGGKITTTAGGDYTINAELGATSVLNPTGPNYVPSGHNLLIVGYPSGSATQSWTMMFVGNTPAHNLTISPSSSTNTNDVASNAAALYVYYAASQIPNSTSTDKTFDWFNFNQIIAFARHLRTAPDATETKFLNDITAAQSAGRTLFPVASGWSTAISTDGTSAVINADVVAVSKDTADSTVPALCPGINQCSGGPTP